jgi:hypothetical protein
MTKGKNIMMNKDNIKITIEKLINSLIENKSISISKDIKIIEQIDEFLNNKKFKLKWEKKEKKSKDLEAPKRAKNAYIFYSSERRVTIKEKNPKMNPKEITKQISDEWNRMSEKQKKMYNDLAADDRVRYANEMKEYKPSENEGEKKIKKTGYHLFIKQKRSEVSKNYPNLKAQEITKKLAEMWKELDKDEQKKFNDIVKDQTKNDDIVEDLEEEIISKKTKKDQDEDDRVHLLLEKIEKDIIKIFQSESWDYDNNGLEPCIKGEMSRKVIENFIGNSINYKDDCEYEENDEYPVAFYLFNNKLIFKYSENTDEDTEIQEYNVPNSKLTKEHKVMIEFLKSFK